MKSVNEKSREIEESKEGGVNQNYVWVKMSLKILILFTPNKK